jgi:diaminohydroxyphosphoribosylaminopyrimidine deaminase / 5-amino-6-(5-phosphoribosylamino)uracil reductase
MEQARVSDAVWDRLLHARTNGGGGPSPGWSAAERAAWALYAPLAMAAGRFLLAQVGQSLDGRIATPAGDASAVSGLEGMRHLHRCRALSDAVVVGVRTALQDDPRLTTRLVGGPSPARVVIDPKGRLPATARVFAEDGARRIVVQSDETPRPAGVETIRLPAEGGWIDPASIARALFRRGLSRLLIEGGGVTLGGFLDAGLLDRLHVAVAPIIIGAGPNGLHARPVERLADALRPPTRVFGLETDVVFDCALSGAGAAVAAGRAEAGARAAT